MQIMTHVPCVHNANDDHSNNNGKYDEDDDDDDDNDDDDDDDDVDDINLAQVHAPSTLQRATHNTQHTKHSMPNNLAQVSRTFLAAPLPRSAAASHNGAADRRPWTIV